MARGEQEIVDIAQIYKEFPDQESCARYLEKIRWDGVPRCPYCKSENSRYCW